MKTDVLIVGCGVSGLYCALNLPCDKNVLVVTKSKVCESDSFLAQGGICVQRDKDDFRPFYEDTLRAGHDENNPESVKIMISSSRETIDDLVGFGVEFERDGEDFDYTKEGAHSRARILFHKDETGKEITTKLLDAVKSRPNIKLVEDFTMVDLITQDNCCMGIIGKNADGEFVTVYADYTVLATGGIGGLYKHSTNYRHLTGDALAVSLEHGVKLQNIDYIQIHPTTLYTEEKGREFLISESVRGEGAILLNSQGKRFVDELLPRDVVANAIFDEMKREGSAHVWLSLEKIPKEEILNHFPNIYHRCMQAGFDITAEPIPVVPSQHYFMGGIRVDTNSRTSMDRLYAVGETACNGVHGKNRLASNSLLESLVFSKRAASDISSSYTEIPHCEEITVDEDKYKNYQEEYKQAVLDAIEKEKNHE